MEDRKGSISCIITIIHPILFWNIIRWIEDNVHPYNISEEEAKVTIVFMALSVVSLVLGLSARKSKEDKILAVVGTALSIIELIGEIFWLWLVSSMKNGLFGMM